MAWGVSLLCGWTIGETDNVSGRVVEGLGMECGAVS